MSYALLWIELLVVMLLWVAALLAMAGRVRRRLFYEPLAAVIVFSPLPILNVFVTFTTLLKFRRGIAQNYFAYTISLAAAFLVGGIALQRMAHRRPAGVEPRAGASWPKSKLVLAVLVAAAIAAMTIWNMDLAVRTQISALRAEAGALMLSAIPPMVSDDQNAAFIYEEAGRRINADRSWTVHFPDHPFNIERPDFTSPAIRNYLAGEAPTIALIRQAADLPDCYFEGNYAHPSYATPLPGLAALRFCTDLLLLHARSELSQGRIDSAIDDINALFRMSQHLDRAPFEALVYRAIGINSATIKVLEEMIPAMQTPQQLQRVKLNDPKRTRRTLQRVLPAEEAMGLSTICAIANGSIDLKAVTGEHSPNPGGLSYRLFFFSDDVAAYQQAFEHHREFLLKPYHEVASGQPGRPDWVYDLARRSLLTSVIFPSFSGTFERVAMDEAQLQNAQLALAAARFRLDHGQLPTNIGDLVPNYIAEIPTDPFDGKPMRYKKTDEEAVFYSVGFDGKDDGGKNYFGPKKVGESQSGDIIFRLKPQSKP
jgi:type II secretory pathway pseudopilin PulG